MTSRLSLSRPLRMTAATASLVLMAAPVLAFDYPTADRVTYVQECMRMHPGPGFEMLNKCSCTIDRIARDVSYEEFVTMSTEVNANTISGERGNFLRDSAGVQSDIKRFKSLQIEAKKSCFINLDTK